MIQSKKIFKTGGRSFEKKIGHVHKYKGEGDQKRRKTKKLRRQITL